MSQCQPRIKIEEIDYTSTWKKIQGRIAKEWKELTAAIFEKVHHTHRFRFL
uniref:Uncharacterized protein n=1 Tax=Gorilla gorilla gorilla TaxID=9595 RepID=A0A2I2ZHV1_GORGO